MVIYCYLSKLFKESKVVTCYYDNIVLISPSVSDGLSVLYNGGIPLQSYCLSIGKMQVSSLDLLMGCL